MTATACASFDTLFHLLRDEKSLHDALCADCPEEDREDAFYTVVSHDLTADEKSALKFGKKGYFGAIKLSIEDIDHAPIIIEFNTSSPFALELCNLEFEDLTDYDESDDDDFDYSDSCDCCVMGWDKPNEWGRCICWCDDCGTYLRECKYACREGQNTQ